MGSELPEIRVVPRRPEERIRCGDDDLGASLLDFWRWSGSDLVGNTQRGVLAEYLVALALGANDGVRPEWREYDLETPDGTKVEVKSAAYVQTWSQRQPSAISFGIAPRRAWDPETNEFADAPRRHADVYVFCLLAEKDQSRIDPLDASQWEFYVLSARALDERAPEQKSVSLGPLIKRLGARRASFSDLAEAVRRESAPGAHS